MIGNAACEPHVQDLCRFLVSLGAEINGIESNVLRIHGVDSLSGGEWRIGPDHIEVASFVGLAAMTASEITIEATEPRDLISILPAFARLGVRTEIDGTSVHVPAQQQLLVEDDLGGHIPKIEDGPWPAFPADLTSIALTVATQAFGTVLIFEKMFESRLFFVDKLVGMGPGSSSATRTARSSRACDARRAADGEPGHPGGHGDAARRALRGGQSTIGAAHQIDKGYERIDERLRSSAPDRTGRHLSEAPGMPTSRSTEPRRRRKRLSPARVARTSTLDCRSSTAC